MTDFQKEKKTVLNYFAALDGAEIDDIPEVERKFAAHSYVWRGFHPFGEITSPLEVGTQFWQPLRRSLKRLQRRQDVFFAGTNEIDGHASVWVVSMGHLMGLFDEPWLGVQPTGKVAMLRYCAFHQIEDDKITQTQMYFDLPHLMAQAGQSPFPVQTA